MKVEANVNSFEIENCGDYNNIRINVVFSLDSNLKINLADKVEIDIPVSHNLEKYSDRDLEMELERRKSKFKDGDLVFIFKKIQLRTCLGGWDKYLNSKYESGKIYLWPNSIDSDILSVYGFRAMKYKDLKNKFNF